ncbi:hypothetical protein CHS0354_025826 [Potamilus streckersoni]|uniref:Uncharacterized protein n=1 Tax=Potamilus streckersoni TaxID=2493646 RepID=A0AAE0SUE5_9BIVA|nr:hypothetical protein CHS0354_025826 [Potamilus streckersoni]
MLLVAVAILVAFVDVILIVAVEIAIEATVSYKYYPNHKKLQWKARYCEGLVAKLDKASDYGSGDCRFESCRARYETFIQTKKVQNHMLSSEYLKDSFIVIIYK